MEYTIKQHVNDKIKILTHPRYGQQMWTTVKVRKHKVCIITGVNLKGREAFAPVSNGGNRMDRISIEAMNHLTHNYYE